MTSATHTHFLVLCLNEHPIKTSNALTQSEARISFYADKLEPDHQLLMVKQDGLSRTVVARRAAMPSIKTA
jgi:hypothetical protein